MHEPVAIAGGVGDENLDITSSVERLTRQLKRTDDDNAGVAGQSVFKLPNGLVALDHLGCIPRLVPWISAGEHPGSEPHERTRRGPMFDQLAAREHQLGGIMTDCPERHRRLVDERTRADVAGPCHVPQTLDRMHRFGS